MLQADLLRKLGLFVENEFLDAVTCARIIAETRSAPAEKSIVVGVHAVREMGGGVDESSRKAWHAQVRDSTRAEISDRLERLRPKLERHFDLHLSDCEGPNFLRYETGGFHVPHRDSRPGSPPGIRRRAVSVIIFLNRAVQDSAIGDGYGGGELVMYGLVDDPKWQKFGFPIPATPGLLVAYRSNQMHEIKPIKFGQRYSIVAWLLQDPPSSTLE
ncbi:2OG-Fe(II) oxygenase [Candidatus Binatus sp.]|uniref:2OG-Fe(II) oxygenase n=1 Tax=Candidatus Binatus sp. TaxID=2811406 RepID=UPI003BB1D1FF